MLRESFDSQNRMSPTEILFAAALIAAAWQTTTSSDLEQPLQDLAPETSSEIMSILSNGTLPMLRSCPVQAKHKVGYWLYTDKNPNIGLGITSFLHIHRSKPIVFLIHGYLGFRDSHTVKVVKNAYVKTMAINVIVVDWEKQALGSYSKASCNVPVVGADLADFISRMSSSIRVPLEKVHIVGLSLGAQVAAEAGKILKGEVGRITGLDPAGPLYQGLAPNHRLDESDAKFVDVIHTNQGQFGYKGNIGNLDYYPNCGQYQPGCLDYPLPKNLGTRHLNSVLCSHLRSSELFAESITLNDFPAWKCLGCGKVFCAPLPGKTGVQMGHYTNSKQRYAQYVVLSNEQAPYGKNHSALPANYQNAAVKSAEAQEFRGSQSSQENEQSNEAQNQPRQRQGTDPIFW